jgi:Na+/melibiose symporter-like transporter
VAGVLIGSFSWRAIFFLSLPLVLAAASIAGTAAEESRDDSQPTRRVDVVGSSLVAVGLGALSFTLIEGPDRGWANQAIVVAGAIGLIGMAGFFLWERTTSTPLLPLGLFRSRNFTAANLATLALYAVFNGNFFVLTIYLQTRLGYSPLAAGAATLPVTLLMIFLASRLGRLAAKTGPRWPMSLGMLLTATGIGLLALVRPGDVYAIHVLPGVLIFGVGLALTVPPLTNTAISAVADSQAGIASGVNDEAARVAALLGVGVVGLAYGTAGYPAAMVVGVGIAVAGALASFLAVVDPSAGNRSPSQAAS